MGTSAVPQPSAACASAVTRRHIISVSAACSDSTMRQQPSFIQLSFSNLRTSAPATALHAYAAAVLSFSVGSSAASIRDSSFSNFSDSTAGQLAATAFIQLERQRSIYGTQLQQRRHTASFSSASSGSAPACQRQYFDNNICEATSAAASASRCSRSQRSLESAA